MIRVLYFVDRLRRGGIQSLLYNMLQVNAAQQHGAQRVEFEVLTLDDGVHYGLEDDIRMLGVVVRKLYGVWLNGVGDVPKYRRAIKLFFREHHNYDAVHINTSSKNAMILFYARKYGIPVRIAHAHNAGFQTTNKLKIAVGNMLKLFLYSQSTHHLACSDQAGRWLFGKRKFTFLPNGIIADNFKYRDNWRSELRAELGVADNCLLLGCVGRFVRQKNHAFLVPVLQRIKLAGRAAKLVLIGVGELENDLRALIEAANVADMVIFAGFKNDCFRWYSALDVLVMPSLYEGLPVTMVEAQSAGLPVVAANTITPQAAFSPLVSFLPINNSYQAWADAILSTQINPERAQCNHIANTDFEMHKVLHILERIYEGIA